MISVDVQFGDELVKEEPPKALGGAGVPGEQGSFHHFGQVDEREDGLVEVREIASKDVLLLGGEVLSGCDQHWSQSRNQMPRTRWMDDSRARVSEVVGAE